MWVMTRKKQLSLACYAIADQIITWPADVFSWFGGGYTALFGFGLMIVLWPVNAVIASPFWLAGHLCERPPRRRRSKRRGPGQRRPPTRKPPVRKPPTGPGQVKRPQGKSRRKINSIGL
jgi:hypothetical protein